MNITFHETQACTTEDLEARLSAVKAELIRTQHAEGDRLVAQTEYNYLTSAIARRRASREDTEGCNQYL